MSSQIIVSLDSVVGKVLVTIVTNDAQQKFEFSWKQRANGDIGFTTNFHEDLIRLTYISAQVFIDNFVGILQTIMSLDSKDVLYINDRGEHLTEVQFLPPTFEGNAYEIIELVERQETLSQIYNLFENSGRRLTTEFLDICAQEGILEDFLTIIESKLSGIRFNLDCLDVKET